MTDRNPDALDLDLTENDRNENIYEQSLSNSQRDNVAKDNVPDTQTVRVEGATEAHYQNAIEAIDRHFRAFYAGRGYGYDFFEPAYRLGVEMAYAHKASGADWSEYEPEMQQMWERVNGGTWELVQDAVKHGWNTAVRLMHG